MTDKFKKAYRYLQIIRLLDEQISEVEKLITLILEEERIICFHFHTSLLYADGAYNKDVDPYEDYIGQMGIPGAGPILIIPPMMNGKMLNPADIKNMLRTTAPKHSPPVESTEFKLNTPITAAVLQVILDGYKAKKLEIQLHLSKLQVFADPEEKEIHHTCLKHSVHHQL